MGMLYYGDNLEILSRYVKDETVDLIYLDPPLNSNAANVPFKDASSHIKPQTFARRTAAIP